MEDDRYNPLTMEEQEIILQNAVEIALKSDNKPGTKDFVVALAQALAKELGARCVDKRLYT